LKSDVIKIRDRYLDLRRQVMNLFFLFFDAEK